HAVGGAGHRGRAPPAGVLGRGERTSFGTSSPTVARLPTYIVAKTRPPRTCLWKESHTFVTNAVSASARKTRLGEPWWGQSPARPVGIRVQEACRKGRRTSGCGFGSSGP